MTGTMFFNMLLNIGLLVLLATLLTNMASVRKLFRGESSTIIQKMALAGMGSPVNVVLWSVETLNFANRNAPNTGMSMAMYATPLSGAYCTSIL